MTQLRMAGPLATALTRRRFLQIGFWGPLALARPAVGGETAVNRRSTASFGRAKRCILVFLNRGPSKLDTWDMKPKASA
jgi:Protein of unknown function (DUF1501)